MDCETASTKWPKKHYQSFQLGWQLYKVYFDGILKRNQENAKLKIGLSNRTRSNGLEIQIPRSMKY